METEEQKILRLKTKCFDNSFHSFGKAYLFEKRAQHYNKLINWLTILGIIVPISIGATATGYGLNNVFLKNLIAFSIPVSIIQLLISIFSIIYKWSDQQSYAIETVQEHQFLSERFKKLGEFPPENYKEFDQEFEILNTRLKSRIEQDSKHGVKEWELRMGMRFALREFQRECVGCKITPLSMEYSECTVCGKFNNNLINRL
jgi:mobilome CxxCx(11)CxxC protein